MLLGGLLLGGLLPELSAPGGVSTLGGVYSGGVCSQGGVCSRGVGPLQGGVVSQHVLRQTPPVNRITHTPVKTLPWPNFVAAGNKGFCPFIQRKCSKPRVFVVVYEISCSSKRGTHKAVNRSGCRAPVPTNTLPNLTRHTKQTLNRSKSCDCFFSFKICFFQSFSSRTVFYEHAD